MHELSSMLKANGCSSPRMQSVRQMAHMSALNPTLSNYGEAIVERNPQEIKVLEQTLANLDRSKTFTEREIFWKQRQFLMDKAFDENNELRFAKLNDRIIKTIKRDAKNNMQTFKGDDSQIDSEENNHTFEPDTTLTGRFFPVIPMSDEERCKSSNYARISESKKRFRAAVRANQAALALFEIKQKVAQRHSDMMRNRKYSITPRKEEPQICSSRKTSVAEVSNEHFDKSRDLNDEECKERVDNPGFLRPLKCDSANFKKRILRMKIKEKVINNNLNSSLLDTVNVRGKISDSRIEDRKTSRRVSFSQGNQSNGSFNDNLYEKKFTAQNAEETEKTGVQRITLFPENDLSGSKKGLSREESFDGRSKSYKGKKKGNSDDLILRLSRTLPFDMLIKSKDSLHCLTSAIGYEARNRKFLEKEKTFTDKIAVKDERFQKLQKSLSLVKL